MADDHVKRRRLRFKQPESDVVSPRPSGCSLVQDEEVWLEVEPRLALSGSSLGILRLLLPPRDTEDSPKTSIMQFLMPRVAEQLGGDSSPLHLHLLVNGCVLQPRASVYSLLTRPLHNDCNSSGVTGSTDSPPRPVQLDVVQIPRGTRVLIASPDSTTEAMICESATGEIIQTLRGHHKGILMAADFAPDGLSVLTASYDLTAKLWDVETGECIRTFRGHKGVLKHATFSPDGRLVCTASNDHTARVWSVSTGVCLHALHGHEAGIVAVAFNATSTSLVSASADTTARIWNATTGACSQTLCGHGAALLSASFVANKLERVLTLGRDCQAKMWCANDGSCVWSLTHTCSLTSAISSPDGSMMVLTADDAAVLLCDADAGTCQCRLTGHVAPVLSAVFSMDGCRVLTASSDGTAKAWLVSTGECVNTLSPLQSQDEDVNAILSRPTSAAFVHGDACVLTVSAGYISRVWGLDGEGGGEVMWSHINHPCAVLRAVSSK